jgi:tetratricopeptide (TPR) repeat protein
MCRRMSDDDKQQPDRHAETPPVPPTPSDGETFGTPFSQEPVQGDIFSSLAEFASEPDPAGRGSVQTVPPGKRPHGRLAGTPKATVRAWEGLPEAMHRLWAAESTHLSRVQKILLAGIITIAAALLYVLVGRLAPASSPDRTASAQLPPNGAAPPPLAARVSSLPEERRAGTHDLPGPGVSLQQPASAQTVEPSLGDTQREESRAGTLPSPEPLSLQLADKLYLQRDFEHALAMCDKLYRRLPATQENQPIRDFLLLRMALCNKNSGNVTQADTLFRTVSLSRLPILRALARYHQSTMLVSRKRYLEAAAKAYQTVALIEVASYDKKWVSAVQQQCGFLAAEAVTRNLLSLCDADANLPPELWSEPPDIDPFVDMEEPQLRVFLASGASQLDGTVLGPQVRNTGDQGSVVRWSVICNGASIEELLARFAANAGVNIRWTDGGRAAPAEDSVRARPVCLYLTSATTPQVVTTAAGSVGLIAQTDDPGNLRLLDPTSYSSLADHTKILADEAITLWQRFLLTSENDPRATNAHFAMALLQTTRGQFDEALAEYKLVANRFAKHALAPQALLQSGTLRVRLRDYVGAHADLKQLVELYPEMESSDRACLYLADATMKAGLYE